jgi:hypothetical protein
MVLIDVVVYHRIKTAIDTSGIWKRKPQGSFMREVPNAIHGGRPKRTKSAEPFQEKTRLRLH